MSLNDPGEDESLPSLRPVISSDIHAEVTDRFLRVNESPAFREFSVSFR